MGNGKAGEAAAAAAADDDDDGSFRTHVWDREGAVLFPRRKYQRFREMTDEIDIHRVGLPFPVSGFPFSTIHKLE